MRLKGLKGTALSDSPSDSPSGRKGPSRDRRLQDALVAARDQQAARFDAIEEVRALEAARLQALCDELAPVFDDIPEGNTLFVCQVVPGDPPRLWIDLLSYVAIDADGRTFRFVMNAREGREVLAETAEISEISAHVIGYIAHRLIDLERAGVAAPKRLARPADRTYPGTTVALAWACGFAVGALLLFALGVVTGRGA